MAGKTHNAGGPLLHPILLSFQHTGGPPRAAGQHPEEPGRGSRASPALSPRSSPNWEPVLRLLIRLWRFLAFTGLQDGNGFYEVHASSVPAVLKRWTRSCQLLSMSDSCLDGSPRCQCYADMIIRPSGLRKLQKRKKRQRQHCMVAIVLCSGYSEMFRAPSLYCPVAQV